jgi:energy-coupling factor transporter ATP-binding protein EcfA2
MKLLRMTTEGVRVLPDGVYPFAHPTSGEPLSTVLVTGPMGSGKSTLLEAILTAKERAAGYGPPVDPRPLLQRGEPNGRIALSFLLSDAERTRSGLADPIQELEIRLSGSGLPADIDPRLAKLLSRWPADSTLAYLSSARQYEPELFELPESERDLVRLAVSRARDKYAPAMRWIARQLREDASSIAGKLRQSGVAMPNDAPDSLARCKAAISRLAPELRLHGLSPDGRAPWFEKPDGTVLPIESLSDGERDAVLIAATWALLNLSRSIVLIDRPDLFATDDGAARLDALRSLFAEGQLIATVTSEAMLSSLPAFQVIRLGPRASP